MAYILPQKDFVFRDGGSGYIEASLKDTLLSNLLRTNSLKIYDHIVRQVYLIDDCHLKIRIMRVICVKTQKTHFILSDIVYKFKRYSRATIALSLARIIDPTFLDSIIKCICSNAIRKDFSNIVRLFCIECRNCISSWIKVILNHIKIRWSICDFALQYVYKITHGPIAVICTTKTKAWGFALGRFSIPHALWSL